MTNRRTTENPTRYTELDSLRGLAAITVMLGHISNVWLEGSPAHSKAFDYLLSPFATGDVGAVMLFFVLSGFVLALPAVDGHPQGYLKFLIRRIFRIYIPYLCAIAIAVPGAYFLQGHARSGDPLEPIWSRPLTLQLIWQHVLFIGTYDNGRIDMPIWSLIYEMRISILFPLICAFALKLKAKLLWTVAAFLTTLSAALAHNFPRESELTDTFHFTALFLIGIYIASEKGSIGAWLNQLGQGARVLIATLSVVVYEVASLEIRSLATRHGSLEYFAQFATALGAGGLILFSLNSPAWKRVLEWPPIQWLGRVSYSIYLLHFIVIAYFVHLMFGRVALSTILLLAIAMTLVISGVFYELIEVPAVEMGRRFSKHSNPSRANIAIGSR